MSAVSDADREKAIDLTAPWFSGSSRGLAATAIDVLIEAGWRPLVSATLDPKPWRDIYTGARFERQNMLTLGYEFSPGPEYVQDRAAYEPAPATPEREALREQIASKLRGKPVHVEFEGRALIVEIGGESAYTLADAVLAVLPSRETVAPTEEQIARAVGHDLVSVRARAVLALFPGEPREAVEAAQRERDAQIADRYHGSAGHEIAAAIREADRG